MTSNELAAYENAVRTTLKFLKKYAHKLKRLEVSPQDSKSKH